MFVIKTVHVIFKWSIQDISETTNTNFNVKHSITSLLVNPTVGRLFVHTNLYASMYLLKICNVLKEYLKRDFSDHFI